VRGGRLYLVEPDKLLAMALGCNSALLGNTRRCYVEERQRLGRWMAYELYCFDSIGAGVEGVGAGLLRNYSWFLNVKSNAKVLLVSLKNGDTRSLPKVDRKVYEFAVTKKLL
jgi:hypothetical protein